MAILIRIQAFDGQGDSVLEGYSNGNWSHVESFAFGVDRELKKSGEKGGTEDINIGVGELQECTISKSMNKITPLLAQASINGNSLGTAEIDFVQLGGDERAVYMRWKLDRVFVKSWSTSAEDDDNRPKEDAAIYFNKIAFTVAGQAFVSSWNRVTNTPWNDSGLKPLPPLGK